MNKLENEQMRAAGYGAPPQTEKKALCEICGEPMPKGEEMFKYHGFSCNCPKPPLARRDPAKELAAEIADDFLKVVPMISRDKEKWLRQELHTKISDYLIRFVKVPR